MKRLYLSIFIAIVFFGFQPISAQITFNAAVTSTEVKNLLQNVFVSGGVNIYNVSSNNYTSGTGGTIPANVIASFLNGNSSNIGLNAGIVLTTGSVSNIASPASSQSSITISTGSDPQLESIATDDVYDAVFLEFDFIPLDTFISFRYVFASEEYPEYVCSNFNDVFGFFITGPNPAGGNYSNYNIARIPNSTLPVAINSINSGTVGSNGTASNCQAPYGSLAYSSLFVNNELDSTIIFDGFTVPLTAYSKVVPCQIYHFKIAIGDVSDEIYDSGVFLEANSFGTDTTNTFVNTEQIGWHTLTEGCDSLTIVLESVNFQVDDYDVNLYYENLPNNGTDYDTLPSFVTIPAGSNHTTITVKPILDGMIESNDTLRILIKKSDCSFLFDTVCVVIKDYQLPQVTVQNDMIVCNQTPRTLSAEVVGGDAPYNYQWSYQANINPSIQVVPVMGNNYYSVTITDRCMQVASDEAVIQLKQTPVAQLSNNYVTVCPGTSVTIQAGGADNYEWSNGATTTSITLSPLADATYTVTFSNMCGTAIDSVEVHVSNVATANAGIDKYSCSGENVTLSASGGDSYSWSTGQTNATIQVAPVTTAEFIVTATSSCGVASDTVKVIIVEPPFADIAGSVSPCRFDTVVLSASGGTSYVWSNFALTQEISIVADVDVTYTLTASNMCGNSVATHSLNVLPLPFIILSADTSICSGDTISLFAQGNGSIIWNTQDTTESILVYPVQTEIFTATVSNVCGSLNDEVTVTVIELPYANAGVDTSVCLGQSIVLNANATPNSEYLWSNGDTTISITVSPTNAEIFQFSVSNSCGFSSDMVFVDVLPLPIADISTNSPICYGASALLTGNGNGDFLWSTGDTISNLSTVIDSTTDFYLTVTNSCGSVSDTATVTVINAPVANAGSDTSVCQGSTLVLTASGGNTYLWSNNDTTEATSVIITNTSIYYVTVSNSCFSSVDQVEVDVLLPPIVSFSPDFSICQNTPVTITAVGGDEYIWSTGDTISTISVTPSQTTIYTVTVINSCGYSTEDITITTTSLPTAYAGEDVTICEGSSVTLSAQGGNSYLWSNGDTTSVIIIQPLSSIVVTVTTTSSCGNATDDVTVTLHPLPVADIYSSEINVCENDVVQFIFNGQVIGGQYLWDFDGATILLGSNDSQGPNDVYWTTQGTYTVQLIVSDSKCTSAPATQEINVIVCTSVNENIHSSILIFPNPAKDILNILLPEDFLGDRNIELFDFSGKLVLMEKLINGLHEKVNISHLPNGMYQIRIKSDEKTFRTKFLKN